MNKFILGLIFMISPFFTFGHNPLSARYHLESGAHASLLTINLSQDGVNQLLVNEYGKEEISALSRPQLEALIVDYIKSHFNLSVDQKEIVLKKGGIKLGSHQTDLKFVLPPFSEKTAQIDIHIPAFKENQHHQTIFSYHLAGRSDHVILSSDNDYQSTIMFTTAAHSNNWLWLILLGLFGLISIMFLNRNRAIHTALPAHP